MKKAVLIAGVSSGSGKTTVVTGILSALKTRGIDVSAFKCGPDYIDPMFHRQVLGLPSFNLDPFFLEEGGLKENFFGHAREYSIVEGVMGYYDGVGTEGRYSTHTVAKTLHLPVILVINASGMATSAGAMIKGFREFRGDSGIAGVIFNQCSPMMYPFLKQVAGDVGIEAFGFLPREEGISVESRHLGLRTDVSSDEVKKKLERLRVLTETHIDLDGILRISESRILCASPSFPPEDNKPDSRAARLPERPPVIAVARDEAFCFLYEENIEILAETGAEIRYFRPLHDRELPKADALYLPGGYPELYADALSKNRSMLTSVRRAVGCGMPTIAECGGFLYLHRELDGYTMAGVIDAAAYKTPKLQRFGYIELEAKHDNLLCKQGERIRSHEFHYYDSSAAGSDFSVMRARGGQPYAAGYATDSMYAGFPHLYFGARRSFAERFVAAARRFAKSSETGR